MLATSAIALVVAALVIGLSSLVLGPRSASSPQASGFDLTASSCPANPLTGPNFSVCGPTTDHGPVLYPGASVSTLPLNFYNPLSVPIEVTSLTVKFTNTFPTHCVSSAFHVNGTALAGTPPQVTMDFTGHPILVSANSATSSGATYDATLALADSGNQDACKNLPLAMSYTATAQYTDATTTVLTSISEPVSLRPDGDLHGHGECQQHQRRHLQAERDRDLLRVHHRSAAPLSRVPPSPPLWPSRRARARPASRPRPSRLAPTTSTPSMHPSTPPASRPAAACSLKRSVCRVAVTTAPTTAATRSSRASPSA